MGEECMIWKGRHSTEGICPAHDEDKGSSLGRHGVSLLYPTLVLFWACHQNLCLSFLPGEIGIIQGPEKSSEDNYSCRSLAERLPRIPQ